MNKRYSVESSLTAYYAVITVKSDNEVTDLRDQLLRAALDE